jgi:hypothetical protein
VNEFEREETRKPFGLVENVAWVDAEAKGRARSSSLGPPETHTANLTVGPSSQQLQSSNHFPTGLPSPIHMEQNKNS